MPRKSADWARKMLAGSYAHSTALDDCMGELLAALDELQLADDTILVFTADHGDMLGSHGMCEKCGPWDEALRVPLLVRWPLGLGSDGRTNETI